MSVEEKKFVEMEIFPARSGTFVPEGQKRSRSLAQEAALAVCEAVSVPSKKVTTVFHGSPEKRKMLSDEGAPARKRQQLDHAIKETKEILLTGVSTESAKAAIVRTNDTIIQEAQSFSELQKDTSQLQVLTRKFSKKPCVASPERRVIPQPQIESRREQRTHSGVVTFHDFNVEVPARDQLPPVVRPDPLPFHGRNLTKIVSAVAASSFVVTLIKLDYERVVTRITAEKGIHEKIGACLGALFTVGTVTSGVGAAGLVFWNRRTIAAWNKAQWTIAAVGGVGAFTLGAGPFLIAASAIGTGTYGYRLFKRASHLLF